ncbi:MAG: nucleotidyltransferase domain-containing protein [Parachlamydiaceae bacterium]|nr:nucleotidyltransferase domain-containing protein [Parachlamydiaceae bacterium]
MEQRHKEMAKVILEKYAYTFYAFGSRVKGNPRRFSDLDICFFENIPWNVRAHIDEDFEESDLPYKVDVIDWNACDETFQNLIKKDLVLMHKGSNNTFVA